MKKIKFKKKLLGLAIGLVSFSAIVAATSFTIVSCSSTTPPQVINNDPVLEKQYVQYRIDFFNKWYETAKSKTLANQSRYPNGWPVEYDQLLQESYINPQVGINTNQHWWDNFKPFKILSSDELMDLVPMGKHTIVIDMMLNTSHTFFNITEYNSKWVFSHVYLTIDDFYWEYDGQSNSNVCNYNPIVAEDLTFEILKQQQ